MNKILKLSLAIAAILLLASFVNNNKSSDSEVTCYLLCKADLFGEPYTKLEKDLKKELSSTEFVFTKDSISADYVIRIEATTREYNHDTIAETKIYCAYVDATLSIDETATRKRIYDNEITAKGTHTLNFKEAARNGYQQMSKEIGDVLKNKILKDE